MNDNKRTIIITGGGSGIGMETAIKFADNGYNVIITGRTESKLINVSESINNNNGSCSYYTGDVADPDFVSKTVNSVIGKYGKIDILMNNAGHSSKNRNTQNTELNDIVNVFNSNLLGTVLFTQAVLDNMKSNNKGLIINISSWAGKHVGIVTGPAYTAAKHAMNAMNESLNMEHCQFGIRAFAICPGEVATPILDNRPIPVSEEDRSKMVQSEDCGDVIRFLAELPAHVCINDLTISPTWNRGYIGAQQTQLPK